MSNKKVSIEQMAEAINASLEEYAQLATDEMKAACKEAATTVKESIQENAPVDTGSYKKSWTSKATSEDSHSIVYTVYSKNRYQLAHLLEHGHATRNGGRAKAQAHIAPAEEKGAEKLEALIKEALSG